MFNAKETNDSLLVGKDIVELVRLGKNVNQLSQGCFDLTVRPLSAMWGFDTDTFTIPTPEIIEQALSKVGMDKLEIVDDSHIKKLHAESKLDTSLLQKGLSVAKISEVLERIGISNYRIDLGGQLKTNGHLPNGGSWLVAIDRPLPGERHLHKVISMPKEVSMSVMTASAHRYFFDTYGQRYANVLDVRTGKPVSHNLLAVMVLHENPVLAEAWASALLCLGPQISMSLANSENLNVFFVKQQGSELLETQTVTLRDSTNISIQ